MGFIKLVERRTELRNSIDLGVANRETKRSNGTLLRWGTIGLLAGGAICTIATGGVCGLALIGIAATSFFASTTEDSDAEIYQNTIESEMQQLQTLEGNLRFRQKIGQSSGAGG